MNVENLLKAQDAITGRRHAPTAGASNAQEAAGTFIVITAALADAVKELTLDEADDSRISVAAVELRELLREATVKAQVLHMATQGEPRFGQSRLRG